MSSDRKAITAGLSELLERHLERQTCVWAKEVSGEEGSMRRERRAEGACHSDWGKAYPFPGSHGGVPDISRLPAYEGQTDGWKLYWIRQGRPQSRPQAISVYLWALIHARARRGGR